MRHIGFTLGLVSLLLPWAVQAEDATVPEATGQIVTIKTSAAPRETRDYKVDAVVKGKAPSGAGVPSDINAAFSYKIRHRYGRREADGTLPLEVSLLEGEVTMYLPQQAKGPPMEQKLAITPSLYPKLTALLDRDWKITDIFGGDESQLAGSLPGINYGNLVMLFSIGDGGKPHTLGDTWEATVALPNYGESYKFVNTLQKTEVIGSTNAALVRQEITRLPKTEDAGAATMRATVETAFGIDTGKLLRSHIQCEVINTPSTPASTGGTVSVPQQDQAPSRANITIDISPAR